MLIGPVFTRELATAPRRSRFYIARAVYVAGLLVLMATAWMVLTGTQDVRNLGDLARFGAMVFQILAPLQLALVVFFSALSTASAVSQEKDRKTLVLLLLTHLSNSELVLGRLFASLLTVVVLVTAALPLFMFTMLLGGISPDQIGRVMAVTLASSLAAGSLGSTLALWREKTFQTLALTALLLVAWIGFWESVALGFFGESWLGMPVDLWAVAFSPWQAIEAAARPGEMASAPVLGSPVNLYVVVSLLLAAVLNLIAVARVRVWNPSREMQPREDESTAVAAEAMPGHNVHSAGGKTREVWDNPIIWREICTWAYGRRVLIIRLAYIALFSVAAVAVHGLLQQRAGLGSLALVMVPLFVLSLVLVNALAVTSMTAERDNKAMDLLLVTDITPAEFVFGKLGGALYVTKEMVLLPMALCSYIWWRGALSFENLTYLLLGLVVMNCFVSMVGVHVGMIYNNSRSAVGVSLGTVFFLFLGIATCIRIMLAFSGSFQMQLAPFLTFMVGGGIGLFYGLGWRNPSPAIMLASFIAPAATYYAIVSFFLDQTLGVFLVVLATYGFATASMLVPAIYEFDVATGRTTADE